MMEQQQQQQQQQEGTGNAERKARKEAAKAAKLQNALLKQQQQAGTSSSSSGGGQSTHVQLSKALAYILRHGAVKEGLDIGADGFVAVEQMLARPRVRSLDMGGRRKPTLADVQQIVASNDKQRFELVQQDDDTWKVRAVQGHSLQQVDQVQDVALSLDNLHLVSSTPDPVLVIHGTNAAAWDLILASGGLKRMSRNHIHLAKGKVGDLDVISGMRASSTRLIYIDLKAALLDGIPFSLSSNGVILTPGDPTTGLLSTRYFVYVHDKQGNLIWQPNVN